ncbi:hypothetical protein BJ944DRAFT_272941, partial [Cunninghamella echinulata]
GTSIVYHQYLEPFLKQNEPIIDQTLIDTQKRVKQYISIYWKKGIDFLRTFISDSLFKSSENDTAATSTPLVQPDDSITNNNHNSLPTTWNPYNLFYTLMLKTTAADHMTTSQQQRTQETAPSSSSTSSEETSSVLDRSDSYDSLASFTMNKKQQKLSNDTLESNATSFSGTWGDYISSFIWKSSSVADNDKRLKQD